MNNDQTNPWISISDLLSSVVVVLLLMLIFTIISNRVEQKRNRETIFNEISSTLKSYEENGYLILDINNYVIQLSDITFETASACISNDYKQILETISQSLNFHLKKNDGMSVLVEGHSDSRAIRGLIDACGYFENNFQLSTLRAINVREELVRHLPDPHLHKLVGAAGYGDTRLNDQLDPISKKNRRIEIRLLFVDHLNL